MPTVIKKIPLRERLQSKEPLLFAGCYDALSARIAENSGFDGVWISGYAVAATMLASPDIGLVTLSELTEKVRQISAAVDIPVIADGEVGFGNALNVVRTVQEYARAGADGMQLGDEATETCPFLGFPTKILSKEEAVLKIRAARETGGEDFFLVSAPQLGYERTLDYTKAGADGAFVRWTKVVGDDPDKGALEVMDQLLEMEACPIAVTTPFQPPVHIDQLKEVGYKIVVVALENMFAAVKAQSDLWTEFMAKGTTAGFADRMITDQDEFLEMVNIGKVRKLADSFLSNDYQLHHHDD
jgi:2-methylisocitrate lyase-like PEP mutase family enzyme